MKILKRSLIILLGCLVLALGISYISYHTYWAKDPQFEINPVYLSYFHETYDEARSAFLAGVDGIQNDFDSVKVGKIRMPSAVDNDLTVDWCYLPAQGPKERLLVLDSGTHGIEGYTGSAIQRMFMDTFLNRQFPEDMGVLLIHALNPYGFKYRRKVTENNVDLNRNCVSDNQRDALVNTGYRELTGLLMPSGPVDLCSLSSEFFYLVAMTKILEKSMPVLRQAALQGQYEFDKGFYYGGKSYEPQIQALKPLLTNILRQYKIALNVDLHTAYGQRGTLHLFIDKPGDSTVVNGIEQIFRGKNIDWGSGDDFYTINGEYVEWVSTLVPDVFYIPMLFEFGTMDSQKSFGSLKSIQIMILENEGAHDGYKNVQTEQKVKSMFSEMYYPTSPVWRSKVMADAREMMGAMLESYKNFRLE